MNTKKIDSQSFTNSLSRSVKTYYKLVAYLAIFLATNLFMLQDLTLANTRTDKKEAIVTLKLQDQPLDQALNIIAKQLNLDISVSGKMPDSKGSINITNSPLETAFARLMRTYSIANHAILYDLSNKVVYLELSGLSAMPNNSFKKNSNSLEVSNENTDILLDQNQIRILREKNMTRISPKSTELLDSTQINALLKKNEGFQKDYMDGSQLLTKTQTQQLLKAVKGEPDVISSDHSQLNEKQVSQLRRKNNPPTMTRQNKLLLEEPDNQKQAMLTD